MGTRESKKKELQDKIINAAKELFAKNDFSNVTMAQIAIQAGVGLGTAYNYYASKEELFLIANGTKSIFASQLAFKEQTITPDSLIANIIKEIKQLSLIEKSAWRLSLSTLTKAAEKKPSLFLDLVETDHLFIEQIEKALNTIKNENPSISSKEPTILVELIYNVLFTSFLFYVYNENQTFTELENEITAKLNTLLNN